MINGIEVLNTYEVSQINWIGQLSILVAGIAFLLFIISAANDWGDFTYSTLFAVFAIALIISGTLGRDKITTYEVTISDEVSMSEFYEKYEVVDQKGKIFVIRERKEKNET